MSSSRIYRDLGIFSSQAPRLTEDADPKPAPTRRPPTRSAPDSRLDRTWRDRLGRLPPVDLESYRIARHWISLNGDTAETEARRIRDSYRAEGDETGEEIWNGILRAIALIRAVTFRPRLSWKPRDAKLGS